MPNIKRKRCCNCDKLFVPDPRNAKRQEYCFEPECRKASKAASQRRWLSKPENQGYFSGSENVKRVQRWRAAHPGYWRRNRENRQNALQDSLNGQGVDNNDNSDDFASDALQDLLISQHPVILGLIANFTGNTLQDDMVSTLQRMEKLGQDIVSNLTRSQGGHHGQKKSHHRRTRPESAPALQLDRSPPGP
jgi:hypothetical protein